MNNRKWCACGCGRSVAARRRGTKWATPYCRSDYRSREESVQAGSGGLQVSYRKAEESICGIVESYADHCGMEPNSLAEQELLAVVLAGLREALPARQRQRLDARR